MCPLALTLTIVCMAGTQQRCPPTVVDIDPESRAMFPYGFMQAEKYVAPKTALIGDACHRIHPLAGQGVNLGFGDVECLLQKLEAAAQIGEDLGKCINEYVTSHVTLSQALSHCPNLCHIVTSYVTLSQVMSHCHKLCHIHLFHICL